MYLINISLEYYCWFMQVWIQQCDNFQVTVSIATSSPLWSDCTVPVTNSAVPVTHEYQSISFMNNICF